VATSYSSKSLGAGTVGGRGFWIISDAICYQGLYNTNLITARTPEEATTFNDRLPYIGTNQNRLAFGITPGDMQDYCCQSWLYDWELVKMLGGNKLMVTKTESQTLAQRHAHRVLFDNLVGFPIVSAERIQVGEDGYTDPLPGLFEITVVDGSIDGTSARVHLRAYDNKTIQWYIGTDFVRVGNWVNYSGVDHPYLRESIQVSFADGNANINVIPGVAIEFDTALNYGNRAVISIGYEYVNARSEAGALGTINGISAFFQPQSDLTTQPYNYSGGVKAGYVVGSTYSELLTDVPHWRIYNVTGTEQTDCQMSIRPLVRLDQFGSPVRLFSQWFMGCRASCLLDISPDQPYRIACHSFISGSPNTIGISVTNATLSTTIREIDADTYDPTGVVHSDGKGLKCDGTTLYRWDEMGVYFVIADTATLSAYADIHIRFGHKSIQWVNDTSYPATYSEDKTITLGQWGAIHDTDDDSYWPGSPCMPEADRTGIIQSQGHDLEFFLEDLDPSNNHWYNHNTSVILMPHTFVLPTGDTSELQSQYSPYEAAIVVTCDDPRYFAVVPVRWVYQESKATAFSPPYAYPGGLEIGSATAKQSAIVAENGDETAVKLSAQVQPVDGSLVIRVNQISSALADLMAAHGVDIA
jgi:hypothetical protein